MTPDWPNKTGGRVEGSDEMLVCRDCNRQTRRLVWVPEDGVREPLCYDCDPDTGGSR